MLKSLLRRLRILMPAQDKTAPMTTARSASLYEVRYEWRFSFSCPHTSKAAYSETLFSNVALVVLCIRHQILTAAGALLRGKFEIKTAKTTCNFSLFEILPCCNKMRSLMQNALDSITGKKTIVMPWEITAQSAITYVIRAVATN